MTNTETKKKIIYITGILVCIILSIALIYGSYHMIKWVLNDQKDIIRTNSEGQTTEIITKEIGPDIAIYRQIGYEDYSGHVQIQYTITSPSDLTGLRIYFADTKSTFDNFFNNDTPVSDHPSCQKQDTATASGNCDILNEGGIIFYNTAKTTKKIKVTLTIIPDSVVAGT